GAGQDLERAGAVAAKPEEAPAEAGELQQVARGERPRVGRGAEQGGLDEVGHPLEQRFVARQRRGVARGELRHLRRREIPVVARSDDDDVVGIRHGTSRRPHAPLRAARSRGRPLDQRRELGRDIRAEQLGGRERHDLGPGTRRTLRAVGPRGSFLAGGAVGGIGTAAVVLVGGAWAALAALATIPARSARPALASGPARFDQPGEERILGREAYGDAAAGPAAPPRGAVAAAATRPSRLGRATPLSGRTVAAVLPRRTCAAATAPRLDPEPVGGRDGIAVGEHVEGPRVAEFHRRYDQLV